MSITQKAMFDSTGLASGLHIAYSSFINSEPYSNAFFDGYKRIRVLTYSASASAILGLSRKFENIECIFGFEGVLGTLSDVMAFQQQMLEDVSGLVKSSADDQKRRLHELIIDGSLRFYVVKDSVAHAKIYLLEGEHKRTVLVGSANLSERAFSGKQLETLIAYVNDNLAWDHFEVEYNRIKQQSSVEMSVARMIEGAEISLEVIPIIEKANASNTGIEVLLHADTEAVTVPEVIRKVETLAEANKKLAVNVPKPKNGKMIFTRKTAGEILRIGKTARVESVANKTTWLSVSIEKSEVKLNGDVLSLDVVWEDVGSDVKLIVEYFNNYSNGFYGNVSQQQRDYFAFLCWFYFSPYICDLRNRAVAEQRYIFDLPLFAVIYGKSNSGKTQLIETIMQSMFGSWQFVDKSQFTRTVMRALMQNRKRYPVVFDDVDKKQFATHAPDIIKDEQFVLEEYPAFVLSMNAEDHAFSTEVVKRCLLFYTQASLPDDNPQAKHLYNSISQIKSKLSTALYREYTRRLLIILQSQGFPEDFLQLSSKIVVEIFKQALGEVPIWCSVLSMDEYKNKRYAKIKADLTNLYYNNPSIWQVKKNEVILTVANYEVAGLKKDIPDWLLRPGSKGGILVLDRKPLEEFLGFHLSRSIWKRLISSGD
jgi:HKD family nuclease